MFVYYDMLEIVTVNSNTNLGYSFLPFFFFLYNPLHAPFVSYFSGFESCFVAES